MGGIVTVGPPAYWRAPDPSPQDSLAKIRAVGFNVGDYAGKKDTSKITANLHVIVRAQMDVVYSGKPMARPEVAPPIASPVVAPPFVSCYLCERRCKLFAIRPSPFYLHEAKVRTYVGKTGFRGITSPMSRRRINSSRRPSTSLSGGIGRAGGRAGNA